MAFQVGSKVRPELGRADVSGFARAGEYYGQAMANLGAQIGEGIQDYQKNKQITASSLAQLEAISSARPEAYAALRQSGGDVSKSISNIEKGDYKQKDVLSTLGALNAYVGSQDAQQQSRIRAAQLEELEAKVEARKTSVLPFEPRKRVIDGVTYVETKAGEFEPLEITQQDGGQTEAEREIKRVMAANPNLSYTDAVNIKEGVSKIVTDPITGRSAIVNLATGEEKPLRRSEVTDAAVSASLAPDPGASESSLNLYKIAETTTGIVPAIQAAAQRFTGQVGIDVADPELLENIQTFNTAQSDIRRSMRTAPKFLASEMAMLDKELDIAPSAFKDPTTLLAQLRSIDKSIRNRLEGIQKSIKDPTLPADEVSAALRLQKDLINFLRNLNVPQVEQVDTQELYRLAGGTGDDSGAPDISSIANKYLDQ